MVAIVQINGHCVLWADRPPIANFGWTITDEVQQLICLIKGVSLQWQMVKIVVAGCNADYHICGNQMLSLYNSFGANTSRQSKRVRNGTS